MLVIAITGGIASGKSLFVSMLREYGARVESCDDINREMLKDISYLNKLSCIFPDQVSGSEVDKIGIRDIIANDDIKREELNELAHKEIMSRLNNLLEDYENNGIAYVEVPLLFESGLEVQFDYVIMVASDKESRIDRLVTRDNVTRSQAIAMIDCQMSDDQKRVLADIVVENDGDIEKMREGAQRLIDTENKIEELISSTKA